ncbi:MAG TPA: ATP-binding protein [Myxococcales bacterium]|nr:ATP-binding protein [Myxococcales bacterium]
MSPDEVAALAQAMEQLVRAAIQGDLARAQEGAYALGRQAMQAGMGVVQLAALHRGALESALAGGASVEAVRPALGLMAEALASYELALRGYREANLELQRLTNTLEAQVEQRSSALAEAEGRFRTLVEHIPAVTYVAPSTPSPMTTYVSPQIQSMLGFTPEEWLMDPARWEDQMEPTDADRVIEHWAQAVATHQPLALEYRMRTRAGVSVWIRDESAPQLDRTRLGLWQNITEHRELEVQLRQSQKMEAVGQLAGGVAHDFNNLITVMLNFGRFVQEDLGTGHPSAQDLEEVLRAAERAAALTRQLLALSRRHVYQPQVLDLNEVVIGMEKMLRRLIGEDVDLATIIGANAPHVFADRGSLEQVLLNLVVNGRDAMPEGGKLTVETADARLEASSRGLLGAPPGRYVMLAVTDTGVGMGPETQAHIFEPFFTTKSQGRGTGLGLSTVHGIVKQAGGDVQVYSAPGRGTTFKVYFPCADARAAEEGPGSSAGAPTGSEVLLVAEDEQAVRAAIVRALTGGGYTVVEAATPQEALEASRARGGTDIHLLVTDVVMPQMSGAALAEALLKERPDLGVLYLSGYTGGALVHQGLFQSGAAYLQKPFTAEALLQAVRAALDRREGKG